MTELEFPNGVFQAPSASAGTGAHASTFIEHQTGRTGRPLEAKLILVELVIFHFLSARILTPNPSNLQLLGK